MFAPGMNACRSLLGCWTCRLRKKKCDENRPICSTCASLELHCYGFGPRPEWMDRGVLQKAKALEVKRILRSMKNRRQDLESRQSVTSKVELEMKSPDGVDFSSILLEPNPIHTINNVNRVTATQVDLRSMEATRSSTNLDVPIWCDSLLDDSSLVEPCFDLEENLRIPDKDVYRGVVSEGDFGYGFNPTQPRMSAKAMMPTGLIPDQHDQPGGWPDASVEEYNHLEANVKSLLTSEHQTSNKYAGHGGATRYPNQNDKYHFLHPTQEVSALNFEFLSGQSSWSTVPSSPILYDNNEDTLFMHYMDEVFYWQYPFYRSCSGGRGWIFSILRRVKPAYYTTLALSEHHRQSSPFHHDTFAYVSGAPEKSKVYYDMALQEMQSCLAQFSMQSQTTAAVRSVEALISILQLLHLELCCGGTEKWQVYLRAASALIPTLVHQVERVPETEMRRLLGKRNKSYAKQALHSEHDSAYRFVIGSFVLLDIMSCASTRSSPSLDLDHKAVLEREDIIIEHLNGCRNWAMHLILEICQLDSWKKKAEMAQRLSVIDLVKRGGQIEGRLRQGLAKIENASLKETSVEHTSGLSDQDEVTRIFALSAMIYLHTVISGAHPELPEVRASVSNAIAAMQQLKNAKLLRNVVWPFCVAGCLALETEQRSIRDISFKAEVAHLNHGTFREAFKIIDECWETRRIGLSNCDWISVMNKSGRFVLLS